MVEMRIYSEWYQVNIVCGDLLNARDVRMVSPYKKLNNLCANWLFNFFLV